LKENYGKQIDSVGTVAINLIIPCIASIPVLIAWTNMLAGSGFSKATLFLMVLNAGLWGYAFLQRFRCKMLLYEKAIVIQGMFGQKVYPVKDIRAIYWSFPSANQINSRAPRKNNTSAEIVMSNGTKTLRIADSYYSKLEKKLSAYQNALNIPRDLEVAKEYKY